METLELPEQTITAEATWPPAYSVRVSKKAKRINLRILPQIGLEIIVPVRMQKRISIDQVLNEYRSWIEKHRSALEIKAKEKITTINLRALNQTWHIQYQKTFSSQIRHSVCIGENYNILNLHGATDDIDRTHLWLQKWLKTMATKHLIPWLKELSVIHELPCNKVTVRGQQTLWGSCTADKDISLNFKLLFMPSEHVAHIMLHELSHTKHLNHSARFWALLTKLDPLCIQHDNAIRRGEKFVPQWANV